MSILRKQTIKDYFEHRFFWIFSFILSITAIGQVFMLFGNPFISTESTALKQGEYPIEANLLSPGEIYVTLGGLESGSYVRLTSVDDAFSTLTQDLSELIGKTLQEAEWEKGGTELLPEQVLSCTALLPLLGDEQLLSAQWGVEKESLPVMQFDQVILKPALKQGDRVRICFYDSKEGTVWAACAGEREWTENLSAYHSLLLAGGRLWSESVRYIDAGMIYPSRMHRGTFAGEVSDKMSMQKGKIVGAFYDGDTFRYSLMNAYAYHFFEYPDTLVSTDRDDVRFYTNEKISLKISRDGFMQYVETPTDSEKGETSLKEAYWIALKFLKEDMAAAGEDNLTPVLAEYSINNGDYVFYLDYYVGDIPLSGRFDRENGMKGHPVEITVRGSIVHSCRRYVLKVELSEELSPVHNSWLNILDTVSGLSDRDEIGGPVGFPEIVYYDNGHTLLIAWRVEMADGSVRYIPD